MPSGEWTDGAFPIRRARIVAARLDTYRPSSPTASSAATSGKPRERSFKPGLRTNGNCSPIAQGQWSTFLDYESRVQQSVSDGGSFVFAATVTTAWSPRRWVESLSTMTLSCSRGPMDTGNVRQGATATPCARRPGSTGRPQAN
jgi:hypothetical protein